MQRKISISSPVFTWLLILLVFSAAHCFAAERRTAVVDAVAKARGAVVNIRTEKIVQRSNRRFFGFGDSMLDDFFRDMMPPRTYRTQSLGSGVIFDDQGRILTNAHVVDKASKIFVALSDGVHELEAELVGSDERIDLAVLKILEDDDYPWLTPARSDDLMLGESVIAIGNPLGLGHSITTGIISSVQRRIQIGDRLSSVFIQSDALINPGNSGGPLININGELIGINTAIARQAQGIGFSIPIDTVKRVLPDLIAYGRLRRGYFGASVVNVSGTFTHAFGDGGALIEGIEEGSPAQEAGLEVADVVLAIDGVKLSNPDQLFSLLRTYAVGDRLVVDLLRGDKLRQLNITLAPLPLEYEITYTRRTFGLELQQRNSSIYITAVVRGSKAEQIGLKAGDLIAKVDGVAVKGLNSYRRIIEDRLGQLPLTFTVVRDNYAYRIELP